ncbi:hypothetical protein [Ktedonospora formicarum]|uniref:Uncharacterized protein n=1 Tax=Ktedonospora formicarum TaxID=2778364 RepID=A0A8J3MQB6_9CHLR|nr:hypothetical protein [Ktedonospora formicarum]GHO44727.1 hypothetical protein KSX_28900 [Ktedonospora formicarum]
MSQEDVHDMESSGESHQMSIALTIGATIGVMGLVLFLYGLFGTADYARSDGININLWWGLLMMVVGLFMGGGSYLRSRKR